MWWRELWPRARRVAQLVAVLATAALSAGCWEPLYGTHPGANSEGVQDKFAAIEIPPIEVAKGDPVARVAVGMFNALNFNLHNGGKGAPPVYRLVVNVNSSLYTAVIDTNTGRPNAQVKTVTARFRLIELATDKTVLSDLTSAEVDLDIPGSEQRFAGQRAVRDAEDRAILVAAQAIRSRLASYFVAGT